MKTIILCIAFLALLCITSISCQYAKSSLFFDSKCANSMLDLYVPDKNCTANPTCAASNTTSLYSNYQCLTSVPSIGPKNTLQLSIYSDSTCATSNLVVSQIFPLDTCVIIQGVGSYKSTACRYLTIYYDSACTNVKQTVDYSAYNGVCLSGTKYVCSGAEKMIGSSVMIVLMIVVSFFTF